jgi:hypothetical protein
VDPESLADGKLFLCLLCSTNVTICSYFRITVSLPETNLDV